jgi:hypothetical protein
VQNGEKLADLTLPELTKPREGLGLLVVAGDEGEVEGEVVSVVPLGETAVAPPFFLPPTLYPSVSPQPRCNQTISNARVTCLREKLNILRAHNLYQLAPKWANNADLAGQR